MTPARFTADDCQMMRRALALARRGLGRVEPNPMVGCVIARGSKIIGEGYHRRFGGDHAEVRALRHARESVRGATAYVTLEPCSHVGKTPPCADALIKSGIGCVVSSMTDPNAHASGRGWRRLRAAGVAVRVGCLRDEALELNRAYLTVLNKRRPYVILKWAQSLDGRLATPPGQPNAISGAASVRWVHRLRARVDAVVVGITTVLTDDPALTARGVTRKRVAARVVLDSNLRIPLACRLVRTACTEPTVVLTTRPSLTLRRRRADALRRAGVDVTSCRARRGRVDMAAALGALWKRRMTQVMIEGGRTVLTEVLARRLADEAFVFVAPRLIGGAEGPVVFDRATAAGAVVTGGKVGCDALYRIRLT